MLAQGEGMTARDADGKSYLDFTSGIGVNSLGYCHPAWVRAVADQAATLQHTSNLYYTAPDGKLAKKLCRRTGLDAVFFGNSGAEANEGAIKCARKYSVQGEGGVVALDADYVARVAAFCREKDILVIVDEVQTGVGRTGKFLACEHFDLHPDIVTLAKGLGGGLPIGAVLMNKRSPTT